MIFQIVRKISHLLPDLSARTGLIARDLVAKLLHPGDWGVAKW